MDLKGLNVPEVGGMGQSPLPSQELGNSGLRKNFLRLFGKKESGRAIKRGKGGGESRTLDDCEKLKDAKTTFLS